MSEIKAIVLRRTVNKIIDLTSGALELQPYQWGAAKDDDTLVCRDGTGAFHYFYGSSILDAFIGNECLVYAPVALYANLPITASEGALCLVQSSGYYYRYHNGGWGKFDIGNVQGLTEAILQLQSVDAELRRTFVNQGDTGFVAWDDAAASKHNANASGVLATSTFTLLDSGYGRIGSYLVTFAANQSVTIPDVYGVYFVYVGSNGLLGVTQSIDASIHLQLFKVFRNYSGVFYVQNSIYPFNFDTQISAYLGRTISSVVSGSGGIITAQGTIGKLKIVGNAIIEDKGLQSNINDSANAAVTWVQDFKVPSGEWAVYSTSTTIAPRYSKAGVPTAVTHYGVWRLYAITDDGNGSSARMVAIMHTQDFTNLTLAQKAIGDGAIISADGAFTTLGIVQLGFVIIDSAGNLVSVIPAKTVIGSTTMSSTSSLASIAYTGAASDLVGVVPIAKGGTGLSALGTVGAAALAYSSASSGFLKWSGSALSVDTTLYATSSALTTHTSNTSNPHAVTKAQVGLGSVENTALSTWAGSASITAIGTLASGTVPWARLSGIPSYLPLAGTAADSSKLGGQLPAYYATAASLSGYLPLSGGTVSWLNVTNDIELKGAARLRGSLYVINSAANDWNSFAVRNSSGWMDIYGSSIALTGTVTADSVSTKGAMSSDGSSGEGTSYVTAYKGGDGSVAQRCSRFVLHHYDKGFIAESRATSAYCNDNIFALKSGRGWGSIAGFASETDLFTMAPSGAASLPQAVNSATALQLGATSKLWGSSSSLDLYSSVGVSITADAGDLLLSANGGYSVKSSSNLCPAGDASANLGTPSLRWNNVNAVYAVVSCEAQVGSLRFGSTGGTITYDTTNGTTISNKIACGQITTTGSIYNNGNTVDVGSSGNPFNYGRFNYVACGNRITTDMLTIGSLTSKGITYQLPLVAPTIIGQSLQYTGVNTGGIYELVWG